MTDTETLPDDQAAAADALRHIARDEEVKQVLTENDQLYDTLLHAAMRFIGGKTLSACVDTAHEMNAVGHAVTIDYMEETL